MTMSPYYARAIGLALILGVPLTPALALVVGLPWVVAWVAAWSIVTFAFYGLDKAAARRGRGRMPELVLHGLALGGGFVGGWLGRAVFHHKTRQREFFVVLIASTVIWAAVLMWWFVLRG